MDLKALIPPKLRLMRSRMIHRVRQDASYFEERERADFFRRAFRALQFNRISGDYAEFGCCGGMTFGMAHASIRKSGGGRRLWAFDSFEGLPPQDGRRDSHPKWVKGDMAISVSDFHSICQANGLAKADYSVVPGFFDKSLAANSLDQADRPRDIALAYIDCDLYSSTLDVLEFLSPRLRHGMILAFDDYFCWSSDAVSGERLAVKELALAREDLAFSPYLTFGWHGMSFMVESRAGLATDEASIARLRLA